MFINLELEAVRQELLQFRNDTAPAKVDDRKIPAPSGNPGGEGPPNGGPGVVTPPQSPDEKYKSELDEIRNELRRMKAVTAAPGGPGGDDPYGNRNGFVTPSKGNRAASKTVPAGSLTVVETVTRTEGSESGPPGGGGAPSGGPGNNNGSSSSNNRRPDNSGAGRPRGRPGDGTTPPGDDGPGGGPGGGDGGRGRNHRETDDEDEYPRAREAEKVNVPPVPNPSTFMRWIRLLADECGAASPYSDEAIWWLLEVLTKSFDELGYVSKKFKRLDAKLKAGVKRVASHGLLGNDIDTKTSELEKRGLILRGRQLVHMIKVYNDIDDESEHLFGYEDMSVIRLVGNDLAGFISLWESTLARVDGSLDRETILRPMLYNIIKDFAPIAGALNYYKMLTKGHEDRTYAYLIRVCKTYIKTNAATANRAKVQKDLEAGLSAPKASKGAVAAAGSPVQQRPNDDGETANALAAKVKGPKKAKTFDEQDARSRKLCFAFQDGLCTLGDNCIYGHEKAKPYKRPQSPPAERPARARKPRSEIPCGFWSKGTCRGGDKCEFKHEGPEGTKKED